MKNYKCDKCDVGLMSLDVGKDGTHCLCCKDGRYVIDEEAESFWHKDFHNFGNVDHPTVSC